MYGPNSSMTFGSDKTHSPQLASRSRTWPASKSQRGDWESLPERNVKVGHVSDVRAFRGVR